MFSVLNRTTNTYAEYYTIEFIRVIEDHLQYLKDNAVNIVTVGNALSYRYLGDYSGILQEINVPRKYHYAVMRVNGYMSSFDYQTANLSVIIPDFGYIDSLLSKTKAYTR